MTAKRRGEGVCSVVVRTPDVEAAIAAAKGCEAGVHFVQHRETGDIVVDEADLSPVYGMGITILTTNLPD